MCDRRNRRIVHGLRGFNDRVILGSGWSVEPARA